MKICGYHLRCSNAGKYCEECSHQDDYMKRDYLDDVLNIWPKGNEAVFVPEMTLSQTEYITPLKNVF